MIEMMAGFYGRQSTDEDNVTRDNQLKWARQFIATIERWLTDEYRQPVRVVLSDDLIFFDKHQTGVVYERPEYDRCKQTIPAREVPLLIVYAIDRIGRGDPFETIYELRFWRQAGVRVYSQSENAEATSKEVADFLRTSLASSYAHEEWLRIRKRTTEGRFTAWQKDPARASFGGKVKLGYRLDDDKHFAIDPAGSQILDDMVDWVLDEHLSYADIGDRLNARGIPTADMLHGRRQSARWTASTVRRILTWEPYATGQVSLEADDGSGQRHTVTIPVPVLISPERFQAMQRILRKRRRVKKRKNEYLLKEALICLECGEGFVCTSGHRYVYYACRGRRYSRRRGDRQCCVPTIRTELIEPPVWRDVVNFVNQPEIVEAFYAGESTGQIAVLDARLVEIEAQLERKRRACGRLAMDFALEHFSESDIRVAKGQLDGDVAELERQHLELELNQAILREYESRLARLGTLQGIDLDRLPHDGKVALIMELVDRIEISLLSERQVVARVYYQPLDTGGSMSYQMTRELPTYTTEPIIVPVGRG